MYNGGSMKIFKVFIYIILPALIFLSAVFFISLNNQKKSLPIYGSAPDFRLMERSGRQLKCDDLKGAPWIAGFIFTRCLEQCPMIGDDMRRIMNEVEGIRLVSFSVDPNFDTPAVLSEYAKRFEADPARWFFLTGQREVLNHVTTSFHMNKIDEPMFHSASLVLMDSKNRVRGFYDANDPERIENLKRDAKSLMQSKN